MSSLQYKEHEETIAERLKVAHDPKVAKIRAEFFAKENEFFKDNIKNKRVLVGGSGLGHDSSTLAENNVLVVGVEILPSLVEKSQKEFVADNLVFELGDITNLRFGNDEFDVAVLNMGTIGNFDDKVAVLKELLRVAPTVYFDFYPVSLEGLLKREEMYREEKWQNVRIVGGSLQSDDGLNSTSLEQSEINRIVETLKVRVQYFPLTNYATMVEMSKI